MANTYTAPTWIKSKPNSGAEKQVGDSDPQSRTDVINRWGKGMYAVQRRLLNTLVDGVAVDFTDQSTVTAFADSSVKIKQLRESFRGLHLRTHPNNDVRKTTVQLIHCDELINDAGFRCTPADGLTAAITSSGAGGLDTGAEGASRWYEIHHIRNSTTAAESLLLHRAKDYLLDQSQNTTSGQNYLRNGATDHIKIGQGIQTSITGKVERIDLPLLKYGAPTGNIWMTLETDSGGSPSGVVLATSDKLDASLITTTGTIQVAFIFRTPATLTLSTQYHWVLQGDYATSGVNRISVFGSAAGVYAGGVAKRYDGSSWSADDIMADWAFKVYVTENDVAITYPSGYDQKCLLGYVFNNSGSDFDPMKQRDREVFCLVEQAVVTSITADVATLTSLPVPPRPVTITFGAGCGTASGGPFACAGVPDGYAASTRAQAIVVGAVADGAATTQTTSPQTIMDPVETEFQAAYFMCGFTTAHFWLKSWRW